MVETEKQPDPSVTALIHRVKDTDIFLRLAAAELRRIAERTPDVAAELQRIARQLDAEADERI
jgi:hypothetical protein